jgi:5S rRNA maturation endonuclease (ribonuclease M5)
MIGRDEFLMIRKAVEDLIHEVENGAVVVVEGRRDAESLRNLGISGTILLSSVMSDAELVDSLTGKKVVIMTDWDRRGEITASSLMRKLNCSVDTGIRRRIFSIASKEVTKVEELYGFFQKYSRLYWNRKY